MDGENAELFTNHFLKVGKQWIFKLESGRLVLRLKSFKGGLPSVFALGIEKSQDGSWQLVRASSTGCKEIVSGRGKMKTHKYRGRAHAITYEQGNINYDYVIC